MMKIQQANRALGGHRGWCVVLCAVFLFFAGCSGPPEDLLDRMTGRWVTDAPGYEGAAIELSRRQVIFHSIYGTLDINRVADITYAPDRYGDLLTIEFRNQFDQKYLLTFYLIASPEGDTLIKKNQKHIIWRKTTEGQ